jgi:hypothetical protein
VGLRAKRNGKKWKVMESRGKPFPRRCLAKRKIGLGENVTPKEK